MADDEIGVEMRQQHASGARRGGDPSHLRAVEVLCTGIGGARPERDLDEHIEGADLVITGEGFLDEQSFEGKVVGGVAELAGLLRHFDKTAEASDNIKGYLWGKLAYGSILIATALGLLAAIPATIFYNKFAADASKIGARLENFADEFSAIISRQLDERV